MVFYIQREAAATRVHTLHLVSQEKPYSFQRLVHTHTTLARTCNIGQVLSRLLLLVVVSLQVVVVIKYREIEKKLLFFLLLFKQNTQISLRRHQTSRGGTNRERPCAFYRNTHHLASRVPFSAVDRAPLTYTPLHQHTNVVALALCA